MNFLADYGLFLAEIVTLVVAILVVLSAIIAMAGKAKHKDKLKIKKVNKKYQEIANKLNQYILTKKQYKQYLKKTKKAEKDDSDKKRNIFILQFAGDIKASAVEALRNEITAVISVASVSDEIIVNLESAGGMVNSYGLAASQLQRIKDSHIPLTICIDKMAASGGYLMACVADKILAAPFAIIGSIGVVAQLPNFNRLLKKNHIDYELLTAGEYKRTLTLFGENNNKARAKFQEDIESIHHIFKDYISEHRPAVDINKVATGEHWLAKEALQLRLVDDLITSDDYLLKSSRENNLYEVSYQRKRSMVDKFTSAVQLSIDKLFAYWQEKNKESHYL